MSYNREIVLCHDDNADDIIQKVNDVLLQSGQRFAIIADDPEDEIQYTQTFRLISRCTNDWGYYHLKGHVLRRPYTKEEIANLD